MAEEAFALSPISARAAQPSEADYDAIREAFMETSRGRWFLGEYAKRNRNADTTMVLDAVARIEEALASQRQAEPADDRLAEALAAIGGTVARANAAAVDAFDDLRLEEHLAPIRKGARILKEISWRWREIGADGRICDILDAQVAAIEAGSAQLSSADPRAALAAAFDLIRARVAEFAEADGMAETSENAAAPAARAPSPAMLEAAEQAVFEAEQNMAGPAASPEMESANGAAAHADDEAVLDLVAMEMAAPDSDDAFYVPMPEPMAAAEPPAATPVIDVPERATTPAAERLAEPAPATSFEPPAPAATIEPPIVELFAPAAEAPAEMAAPVAAAAVTPLPEVSPSLGSTIIASGILRSPSVPANDPLAPIRRMSQAEKIAFFS
ncbi:hypothetical protein [Bradyrhizobium sp. NP1]|uniref:hypothetical protein n=1 Tax=Bradyrhizobium sp. NP1 TaxID=3049772 RepID=UPI0025A644EB|nr:hypothetical protein [Bradyrhizobium sp. NP1]WJR76285.1 hypothetical protein QOU61_26465 [Bradyrhizobium sp. NP1]